MTVTAAHPATARAPEWTDAEEPAITLTPPIGAYDHLQGALGAEFSIVEYGDFECPYCRAAAPVIDEVVRAMNGRIVFAFRHFPLAELHPYALSAAVAAEGAALKGQFWPMHARLYGGAESKLRQPDLRRYAEEIGIPPEKVLWPATRFVEDRVEADFNSGVRNGVRGTPTLFLNGEMFRGPITVAALTNALTAVKETTSGS